MKTNTKVKEMVLISLFVALIAVGAFIRIPVPVCPFTLQFLFTTLAGLLLGAKNGAIASGVYVILGLIGVPIFTEGGGISYIFQPTFGYLLGFILGTYATGKIAHSGQPTVKRMLVANFTGMAIVYVLGIVYFWIIKDFYLGTPIGFKTLMLYCCILVAPGDIFICILSAILGKQLVPISKRQLCAN